MNVSVAQLVALRRLVRERNPDRRWRVLRSIAPGVRVALQRKKFIEERRVADVRALVVTELGRLVVDAAHAADRNRPVRAREERHADD